MLKYLHGGNMHRRWYDKEPTLSLAISLLKNAEKQEKTECAKVIIAFCKSLNIDFHRTQLENIGYTLKRWHDKDKMLFDALEYIRIAPEDVRREISGQIIHFLQTAQSTQN